MSPVSKGPTIVLIGGIATLDSGATVDTREQMAGDEWDIVLRQALAYSEAWWTVAKGFVDVVLEQHQRPDAWTLVWLDKSLLRSRGDGSFKRVRLKTFFDDAENLITLSRGDQKYVAGPTRFSSDIANTRYRILPYLFRFADMTRGPAPQVIVGGCHTTYEDGSDIVGDRPLDYFVSRWPRAIIVLPHTPVIEAKALRVLRNQPRSVRMELATRSHPSQAKRHEESWKSLEDMRKANPHVISHDFRITFWTDEGQVRDPVDLQAALTFVKSRYDLSLGLWDLARDPALRETLLVREGLAVPQDKPVVAPKELRDKTAEHAAERQEAKNEELKGRRLHHQAIWPTLSKLGWEIPPWQQEGVEYRLAIGPRVPSMYPGGGEVPSLFFAIRIQKKQATLGLFEPARSGKTEEFLQAHSDEIARLTGSKPDTARQLVCRLPGKGWEDSAKDWPSDLQVIESVVAALARHTKPIADAAAREATNRFKSMNTEVTIDIPWHESSQRKTSLWNRIRNKKRS